VELQIGPATLGLPRCGQGGLNIRTVPGDRALYLDRSRDYVDLKRLIVEAGLLEKRPLSYAVRTGFTLALLAISIGAIALLDLPALHLLNAAFLAIVFGQLGFIAHDAGHRQVFGKSSQNDVFCLAMTSMIGLSRSWWLDKHNRHHSNPNQIDADPDIELPFISFTVDEALQRGPVGQLAVRYQTYIIVALLAFQAYGMQVASAFHVLRLRDRRSAIEAVGLLVHHIAFIGLLVLLLGPVMAVAFFLVHHAVAGAYMGTAFAPNHKGMDIIESGARVDFLSRQVYTSRNVRPGRFVDFWYGGLNYQIEHHLFPSMPRANLNKAREIVVKFCEERSLPHHETGVLGSYAEIMAQLREVSRAVTAHARSGRPAAKSEQQA
jgi:fatty acid desaturase